MKDQLTIAFGDLVSQLISNLFSCRVIWHRSEVQELTLVVLRRRRREQIPKIGTKGPMQWPPTRYPVRSGTVRNQNPDRDFILVF